MTYAWFDVTRNAGIARIMHMSYRSKTYTWKDVILIKRSMIRVFISFVFSFMAVKNEPPEPGMWNLVRRWLNICMYYV